MTNKSDNTKYWDALGKTDPTHTKAFQRSGGFSGTAIKPMWAYLRMTEEFGPCGTGWGVNEPSFQIVPGHGEEVLVYCTVTVWYGDKENTVTGVGGDKIIATFRSGSKSDDEAFKKAFTDAITNALKFIGVGADVHMGMYDDNKYVNQMRAEFSEDETPPKKVETVTYEQTVDLIQDAKTMDDLKEVWNNIKFSDFQKDEETVFINEKNIKVEKLKNPVPAADSLEKQFPGDLSAKASAAADNLRAG